MDRLRVRGDAQQRLAESFETALHLGEDVAVVSFLDADDREDLTFSARFACPECGYSISELEPRMFSFNNPAGACPACDGLGVKQYFDPDLVVADPDLTLAEGAIRGWDRRNVYYFHMLKSLSRHYGFDIDAPYKRLRKAHRDAILYGSGNDRIDFSYINDRGDKIVRRHRFEGVIPNMERRYRETESSMVRESLTRYLTVRACPACDGSRLKEDSRHVYIEGATLPTLTKGSVETILDHFRAMKLAGQRGEIAEKIVKEIQARLQFLVDVGLNYLTLDRSAETLSGGEAQRIRLASQIGAGLVGVMYILDEPSIGLHQRDNARLLRTLTHLRDLGNTVLVVEHDEEAIRTADHVVDIGPGAGVHGGEIVVAGPLPDVLDCEQSITGEYLAGRRAIPMPAVRTPRDESRMLTLVKASGNNLQEVTVEFPVGLLTCVTGVSGSGKSTLVNHTLYPITARTLNGAVSITAQPYADIEGLDNLGQGGGHRPKPHRPHAPVQTRPPTPVCSRRFANCSPKPRSPAPGATGPAVSASTSGAGAAKPARATASSRWRCISSPTSTCPATSARAKRYNRETLEVRYKGKEHPRSPRHDHRGGARILRRRTHAQAEARHPRGRGAVVRAPRPKRHHPLRRRSAAGQVVPGTLQAKHRQDALHPRRTHHRTAFSRHRATPGRAPPIARPGQHGGRHRTQPRRH